MTSQQTESPPLRLPEPRGRLLAVLGPTNTGKTHYAVERMLAHESGMIGLPLRLLAREIYDRVVAAKGADAVALITGEERIAPPGARYHVATVEAMPVEREVAFLAVDEIQLMADRERGHVFTDRLLHARGYQETQFLGAETARGLIRQLLPGVEFLTRSRFSELTYAGSKKLSRLPRRSAIVAFSTEAVYALAELVRRQRGGAAVVMGALSPRTRNAQVGLYQSGDVDFLVATDAIGMGLNMDVDHVAFASLRKFDGIEMRNLRPQEIAQIAGRAGRHTSDGTFGPTGDANALEPETIEAIENHRFEPLKVALWRSRELSFASPAELLASLETLAPARGLQKAPVGLDQLALTHMLDDPSTADLAAGASGLHLLWEVCQVPDFRNLAVDEHVGLLKTIHAHLAQNDGRLPADWIEGHVARLDVTQGDVDTLASRIAQVRTWTYISHRESWLDRAAEWQERTRALEDRLSDALHEALTQRFVDRRTSVLMRRLAQDDDLQSAVSADGEVTVEGEYVGKLTGLHFQADTRASGIDGKMLARAANRALKAMMAARAGFLAEAAHASIELSEHGKLWWEGAPVGRLVKGAGPLSPRIELIADDLLEGTWRANAAARLERFMREHVARTLPQLVLLQDALDARPPAPAKPEPVEPAESAPTADSAPTDETPAPAAAEPAPADPSPEPALTGLARGIAFRLIEAFGALDRRQVADDIRQLAPVERSQLRRLGVRIGEFSVFLPSLLKPSPARLLSVLWAAFEDRFRPDLPIPSLPQPGLCSVGLEAGSPRAFYGAVGFRVLGKRAVRIDMLERLADLLRKAREASRPKPAEAALPPAPSATPEATAGSAPESAPAATSAEEAPALVAEAPDTEETAVAAPDVGEAALPPLPDVPSPPPPRLPAGAFLATGEMMSVVGCSGEDFDGILKALGFRPLEIAVEGAAPVIAWGHAPRGPRVKHGATRSEKRPPRAPRGAAAQGGPAEGEPRSRGESRAADQKPQDTGKRRFEKRGTQKPNGQSEPRRDGPKQGKPGRRHRDEHEERRPREHRAGPRRPEYDPDSPFAALAALKESLKR
ncbi:MAG: disulfide oxidoreductase [Alphaproteobacteria bacterium]|nr:disulfide oxidoreductase [Alphaproteobacteria bacterium]